MKTMVSKEGFGNSIEIRHIDGKAEDGSGEVYVNGKLKDTKGKVEYVVVIAHSDKADL